MRFFFQPADIVNQVLNFGQPAPIDVRVSGPDQGEAFTLASAIARDLTQVPGKLLTLSWKTYPDFALNQKFPDQLAGDIPAKDLPLFFLCRSGGRSLDAAVAMSAAGYGYCFNIRGGFEGEQQVLALIRWQLQIGKRPKQHSIPAFEQGGALLGRQLFAQKAELCRELAPFFNARLSGGAVK